VGEHGTRMRVIAAFFRPCALDALIAYTSVFLILFQGGRPMRKTRNQFSVRTWEHRRSEV